MAGIADLAANAFEKRERVRMLEMMNTPIDYDERKKAMVALELARHAANQAEAELRSLNPLSRHADDKAVADFTRVLNQVFEDKDTAGEHLDELARMMGAGLGTAITRTYLNEAGEVQVDILPADQILMEPDIGPTPTGLIDKLRKE